MLLLHRERHKPLSASHIKLWDIRETQEMAQFLHSVFESVRSNTCTTYDGKAGKVDDSFKTASAENLNSS